MKTVRIRTFVLPNRQTVATCISLRVSKETAVEEVVALYECFGRSVVVEEEVEDAAAVLATHIAPLASGSVAAIGHSRAQ